jgi:hypothetical protein
MKFRILKLIQRFSAWFHGKLIKDTELFSGTITGNSREPGHVFAVGAKQYIIVQKQTITVIAAELTKFGRFVVLTLGYNFMEED